MKNTIKLYKSIFLILIGTSVGFFSIQPILNGNSKNEEKNINSSLANSSNINIEFNNHYLLNGCPNTGCTVGWNAQNGTSG